MKKIHFIVDIHLKWIYNDVVTKEEEQQTRRGEEQWKKKRYFKSVWQQQE